MIKNIYYGEKMPTHTWTIKLEDLYTKSKKHWDRLKVFREIDQRAYYEGFNVGREKKMFQEELKDLETVYKTTLKNSAEDMADILPSLLHYMEKFVNANKQSEVIREKLFALLAKTGREPQEESGDCEGGCDE